LFHPCMARRYDLDTLTAVLPDKAQRRQVAAEQDAAMRALDRLDFAARKINANAARAAYDEAVDRLQGLVGALG